MNGHSPGAPRAKMQEFTFGTFKQRTRRARRHFASAPRRMAFQAEPRHRLLSVPSQGPAMLKANGVSCPEKFRGGLLHDARCQRVATCEVIKGNALVAGLEGCGLDGWWLSCAEFTCCLLPPMLLLSPGQSTAFRNLLQKCAPHFVAFCQCARRTCSKERRPAGRRIQKEKRGTLR